MSKITVYIADPVTIFREGICVALAGEEDIEVVGATGIFKEAKRFIKTNPPDVAILHINGGRPSGLEITRRLKRELSPVCVLLILDNENEKNFLKVVKSGASACVTRGVAPDHLVSTIKEVAKGTKPVSQTPSNQKMTAHLRE